MPVHTGRDKKGKYYRWGNHGKKYYCNPSKKGSCDRAKKQAEKQGRAAYVHGYKG